GNAYFADNQRRKAVEAYNKALELSPAFTKAYYNLGMIYVLEKNKRSATSQYDRLVKLDPALAAQLKAEIDKICSAKQLRNEPFPTTGSGFLFNRIARWRGR